MIDWNKLAPYKTTKAKSFEQLCYQIASRMYSTRGIFIPIDDSGGGDGVEFYLTLPDGKQWGWQAKYYEGSTRLNQGNRKSAIEGSLSRAIELHPNMEIWFLCLPMDLTTGEEKWISEELIKSVPENRKVKIEVWNETFLHDKINRPQFNGIKQAFFNELELTKIWFNRSFEKTFSIVKNKFDELLYVPNLYFQYFYVDPILCNERFLSKRIGPSISRLEKYWKDIGEKLKLLKSREGVWTTLFNEYYKNYAGLNLILENIISKVKFYKTNLSANNINDIESENFDLEIAAYRAVKVELDDFRKNWYTTNFKNQTDEERRININEHQVIAKIEKAYDDFFEELNSLISVCKLPLKWRLGHYLGNGGDGKTNLSVAIVKEHLSAGLPAIYFPAILFTNNNSLIEQFMTILDIKSGYSFGDFLDCLNELGKIHNIRVPVVIDGLNEAIDNQGVFNGRLKLDIPQLESEFQSRNNLALLTTCRHSYHNKIWDIYDTDNSRFHEINGFENQTDKKAIVRKYFEHYKIQADLSFLSLEKFSKPLYLKIYCETINHERVGLKQVILGFHSIYTVFDEFVLLCDKNIFERLMKSGSRAPVPKYKNIASTVLLKIAEYQWLNHQRTVPFTELYKIADQSESGEYKNSITKALLDEELLFMRDIGDSEEYVQLTYDLISGYFIAKFLLNEIEDFQEFFKGESIQQLAGRNVSKLHPYFDDILDGLCNLLPIEKNVFVHDLINGPNRKQSDVEVDLFQRSIIATLTLPPEFIPVAQIEFIQNLSNRTENLIRLISISREVWFVSGHPFNFYFWSSRLMEIPMCERDANWSEYVRNLNEDIIGDIILEFKEIQGLRSFVAEQEEKLLLVLEFLKWTLTCTNGDLKEKISDCLYEFSKDYFGYFVNQCIFSAKIDDPTVFEWMIGILYNAVNYHFKTKTEHGDEFLTIGEFLIHEVLDEKGNYATNHFIINDYAFRIIRKINKVIWKEEVDLGQLKISFSNLGITVWGQEADKNENDYSDGNSLIEYNFEKYKMPSIVRSGGNLYRPDEEYLSVLSKLRWRAYQLGYKFELFSRLDSEIANRRSWGAAYGNTDRYADKYIDVAYQEYMGHLKGQAFDNIDDLFELDRNFNLKYDPTNRDKKEGELFDSERFVVQNFIDPKMTLKSWCNDISVPDLSLYLERGNFKNQEFSMVLLDGLYHQYDENLEKQFFFKVDTLLVQNKDLAVARKVILESRGFPNGLSKPFSENFYESEVPDGDSIAYNELTEFNYSLKTENVEVDYIETILLRDGCRLSPKEEEKLWNEALKKCDYLSFPRIQMVEFPNIPIRFTVNRITGYDTGAVNISELEGFPVNEDQIELKDVFKDWGVEMKTERYTKMEERTVHDDLEAFVPVRLFEERAYLSKNLIESLDLSTHNGSRDLYDQMGSLACFTRYYYVEYVDQESFTYIRKDLIDKYLFENELTLFQIIWGERDYYPSDGNWTKSMSKKIHRTKMPFYQGKEYQP